jgi:hypothetical protein
MDFAERFRQERKKSATSSGGESFAEKFRQETKSSYQKSADSRKIREKTERKKANLEKSYAETEKYLQDYNEATSGFMGSVLKRFGAGVASPTLSASSPVSESPAYKQAQSYGAENETNKNKTFGQNFREGARKILTENTSDTIYDLFQQEGVDKQKLDLIEQNTKNIIELSRRNKDETNPEFRTRRQVAIDSLIEQNRNFAEEVGGEIKNKTTLQLAGQSVGTVLELLPFSVGAGMTQAGKIVLQAGTKQAMKALGKEAALFGAATGASEAAKENGATTGDIIKSGAIGAGIGLLAVAFPGLTRLAAKWGDKKISSVLEKISGKKSEKLTPEEEIIAKEITKETTEKTTESKTVYSGRPSGESTSGKKTEFFTESEDRAKQYAELNKTVTGKSEVVKTEIDTTRFKEVKASEYHNSLEDESLRKEYDGVTFLEPDGTRAYAKFVIENKPKFEPAKTSRNTSGYAESVKAKALEKEMEDSFEGLAEYTPAVRKEQAAMASDLINTDIERVGRILDGTEELPKGLRGSSLAKAVEMYGLKTKDATLIQKLIRSNISSSISESGSELSMLVGRNPRSPLKIARDIVKSRAENLKKRLKGKKVSAAKKEVKEKIRKSIKKSEPDKETWTSFIQDIKC